MRFLWGAVAAATLLLLPTQAHALDGKTLGGTWYELARFPEKFNQNCYGTQARVSPRPDGGVDIASICRKGSLQGKEARTNLKVSFPDPSRLRVQIFWGLRKDLALEYMSEQQDLVAVGTKDKRHVFVISRNAQLSDEEWGRLKDLLKSKGYDVSRLQQIPQKEGVAEDLLPRLPLANVVGPALPCREVEER